MTTDYPKRLREHADALDAASAFFTDFMGTDCEDHAESIADIARQFREDAKEYEAML